MPPRATRSKRAPAPPPPNVPTASVTVGEARQLFILPNNLSSDARIITLSNPATSLPTSYLFCPDTGLYEITQTSPVKNVPRSWLLAPYFSSNVADNEQQQAQNGYVQEQADIFTVTPLDLLFLLTQLFTPQLEEFRKLFRMEDDHLEKLGECDKRLSDLIRVEKFRSLLLSRLRAVSEIQEVGEETAFKPSETKFLRELVRKAQAMSDPTVFPTSMQASFIRKQLEVPVMMQSQVSTEDQQSESQSNGPKMDESQDMSGDRQEIPSTEQVTDDPDLKAIEALLRTRTALSYMIASYVPPTTRKNLWKLIETNDILDFSPLDARLEHMQKLKSEIIALRSMSDNISRKRGSLEDDEAAEARAEKRRKKEEEEKKKKSESRALKDLKKVDTSGMKKLSSFFAKASSAG